MQNDNPALRERVDNASVMTIVAGVFTVIVVLIAMLSAYLADEFTWMISGIMGAAFALSMNFVLMSTLTNVIEKTRRSGSLRIEPDSVPSRPAFDPAGAMTLISGIITSVVFVTALLYVYLSDEFTWMVSGFVGAAIGLTMNLIVMHIFTCLIGTHGRNRVEPKANP